MKEFNYELIKSSTNDFALDRLIGKGSHGSVYKGLLKVDEDHKHVQLVAVKKPSPSLSQSSMGSSKLDSEIQILSSIQSPHIVNLIGVSSSDGSTGHDNKLLVTEFMPNGSLHDLLHSPNTTNNINLLPTWHHRMLIALQVAHAIHVLHQSEPPVIHRDIKSPNILFDRCWNARLADFSLAVTWQQGTHHDDILPAGTFGYLDPGYTEGSRLAPANDVYSFGVLLMELVSGRKVVDVERDPASIVEWVGPRVKKKVAMGEVFDERVQGLTLRSSGRETEEVLMRVLGVAVGCVEEEEKRRPTMGEVVEELRGVVESLVIWRAKSNISWGWRAYRRCVRAWKRCKKNRVRNTTTTSSSSTTRTILCKDDRLIVDNDIHEGEDNK